MTHIEEIVREIYSAIDEWDVDSLMNYFADDVKLINWSNRVYDKQRLRDMFPRGKKAFPDRKIAIERIMTKDNAAMVEYMWTATHTGEYLGFPATNNRIELPCVDILEFEANKIKYMKNVFNWRILDRGINPQR